LRCEPASRKPERSGDYATIRAVLAKTPEDILNEDQKLKV